MNIVFFVFTDPFPESCAVDCRCYSSYDDNAIVADCSGSGLTDIPVSMPVDTDWLLLSQNNISKLSTPNEEISELLSHISKLDISRNHVGEITEEFLDIFIQSSILQVLNVSHNELTFLPQNIINFTFAEKISLSKNKLKCSCKMFWVKDWFLNESRLIENYENIKCQMPSGNWISIVQMDKTDLHCVTNESDSFSLWKIAGTVEFSRNTQSWQS